MWQGGPKAPAIGSIPYWAYAAKGAPAAVSGDARAALDWSATDARAVDLIRVLAMDAVEQAGSGHPGTAMSLAPAAYVLFQRQEIRA